MSGSFYKKAGGSDSGKGDGAALTSLDAVTAYLDGALGGLAVGDPIPLAVALRIPGDWSSLQSAIATADRYVALDLSECTMSVASQGVFDLGSSYNTAAVVLITALT
ncbi:MAG: hypothetical protein LBU03_01435, partial [Tannerellaceae bacterium]|nr:hypothetical protein [Tannerellaceae bacterium]